MIADKINPKYNLLTSTSQSLWWLYLCIKDHKSHQFYYNLELIQHITGHCKPTIIQSNKELEYNEIIITTKSHRVTTRYSVLEKIFLSNGDISFLLGKENLPKQQNNEVLSKENLPNRVKKVYSQGKETLPIGLKNFTPSIDLSSDLSNKNLSKNTSTTVSSTNIAEKPEGRSADSFLDKEFKEFMEMDVGMRHKLLESKSLNPEIKKRYIEMQEEKT